MVQLTSGFGVDPVALAGAAAQLRTRADALAGSGARLAVPGDGDLGRAHPGHAAAIADAVGRLGAGVARCAAALREHADSLADAGRRYEAADADAAGALAAAEPDR